MDRDAGRRKGLSVPGAIWTLSPSAATETTSGHCGASKLWGAAEGSREHDELGVLATLIEAYEREHFPIDMPDAIEAIKFRLEQQGADTSDLVGGIGGRTRVYEVLRGKRPLSLNMIRNLHGKFGIPAEVLIQSRRKGRKRLKRSSARGSRRVSVKKSA